jgi:hypothetical protein
MLTVSFTHRVLDGIYMMLYMVGFHLKRKDLRARTSGQICQSTVLKTRNILESLPSFVDHPRRQLSQDRYTCTDIYCI